SLRARRRIQRARRVAGGEHRFARVAIEPEMIVTDGSLAQERVALGKPPVALIAVRHRPGQRAIDLRSAEPHPDIAANHQRLAQQPDGFGVITAVEMKARAHLEPLRLESARAELTDEPRFTREMLTHRIQVAKL